jgi:hypothetical protein
MVQTNLAFELSMPLVYLLSTISFHVHLYVSCSKR